MLDTEKIINSFKKEGFGEIDVIDYSSDIKVFDFFYVFDESETEAAKEYANENYTEENGEDEWYSEYYLPYLTDIAADNVRDTVDDLCEELELSGEFIAYEMDRDSSDQMEFIVVLANDDVEFDIDQVLEELDF